MQWHPEDTAATDPAQQRIFDAFVGRRAAVTEHGVDGPVVIDDAAPAEIETERLRLRQFRADDLDAYAALCADPVVMEWLHEPGDP